MGGGDVVRGAARWRDHEGVSGRGAAGGTRGYKLVWCECRAV